MLLARVHLICGRRAYSGCKVGWAKLGTENCSFGWRFFLHTACCLPEVIIDEIKGSSEPLCRIFKTPDLPVFSLLKFTIVGSLPQMGFLFFKPWNRSYLTLSVSVSVSLSGDLIYFWLNFIFTRSFACFWLFENQPEVVGKVLLGGLKVQRCLLQKVYDVMGSCSVIFYFSSSICLLHFN